MYTVNIENSHRKNGEFMYVTGLSLLGLVPIWVLIGAVVGYIVNRFVRTHETQESDLRLEIGVAIFGALSAGMVFYILDVPRVENFELWSFAAALAGSGVLLFLLRMYTGYFGARPNS